jgi:NADH dehydrogenase FAD-containing subunit
MTQEVVIIGGNFAGLGAAKIFFKDVIPKTGSGSFHVTLISSSSHAYFNIGAPRLLVEPEKFKSTILNIKDGFQYPESQFSFIQGTATSVDLEAKTVTYDEDSLISYDVLIIATGAHAEHPSFKLGTTHEASMQAIKDLSDSIKKATTVAVIGGGPTGVETAGELGFTYPDKKVLLYTGGSRPLQTYGNLGEPAAKKLLKVNVTVINNVKVKATEVNSTGSTILTLSTGKTQMVDVAIPVFGVKPNSDFLPLNILDNHGWVKTDDNLRVKGYDSVYALGDVISGLPKTLMDMNFIQKATLKATLLHDLVNKSHTLVPHGHPTSLTIAVPVSRNGGVGVFKGWGIPSFLVKQTKAKDFMIPKAGEMLREH